LKSTKIAEGLDKGCYMRYLGCIGVLVEARDQLHRAEGYSDTVDRIDFALTDAKGFLAGHLKLEQQKCGSWFLDVEKEKPKPMGKTCSVCGMPQVSTRHGDTCFNGHGGAPAKEDECSQ
jgi:hypothetical protein